MRRIIRKTGIVFGWLLLWQLTAVWTDNPILLASPAEVLKVFFENIQSGSFLQTAGSSFMKISLGFLAALLSGMLLGALSYRFSAAEEILAPAITVMKSVPVASFVVILLIWFGSSRLSFFISFLIVFPNIYVSTMAGLESTDRRLLEMAEVFRVSGWNRFWYLYRPAMMPCIYGSLKVSLGMSWKSGVAAELIGLPEHSLGERLYLSKIYLDTVGLFAWTLTIVLLSMIFEAAVLFLFRSFCSWMPGHMGNVRMLAEMQRAEIQKTGELPGAAAKMQRAEGGLLKTKRDAEESTARTRTDIQIQKLTKSYGEEQVLSGVELTLRAGRRYLLMAPSGAGKTTLLRLLMGLETADSGSISGLEQKKLGVVFQEDRLCEACDALTNILLAAEAGGKTGQQLRREVIRDAAELLPAECLTKPVRELSGGMKRRVCLLRAVCSGGDVLILDEPFNGMDEQTRARCAEYLLRRQEGRLLLMTTHRREEAELLQGELLETLW